MREQIEDLLNELAFLKMEWDDLGWDMDGCPDSDLCRDFKDKIERIENAAEKVMSKLNEK